MLPNTTRVSVLQFFMTEFHKGSRPHRTLVGCVLNFFCLTHCTYKASVLCSPLPLPMVNQVGMCMKGYGYAVGDYRRGFVKHARSLEPESIGGMVLSDCQVKNIPARLDVHLPGLHFCVYTRPRRTMLRVYPFRCSSGAIPVGTQLVFVSCMVRHGT